MPERYCPNCQKRMIGEKFCHVCSSELISPEQAVPNPDFLEELANKAAKKASEETAQRIKKEIEEERHGQADKKEGNEKRGGWLSS